MRYPDIQPLWTGSDHSDVVDGGALLIKRVLFPDTPESAGTPGAMYYRPSANASWEFIAHTLERPDAVINGIKGRIPAGEYPLALAYSPTQAARSWSKDPRRPLVLNVAGRQGIQLHAGSAVKDSKGCVLVGHFDRYLDHLPWEDSKATFMRLVSLWSGVGDPRNPQKLIIQEIRP